MRSFTFQVPESGILPDGARLTCANAIKELAGLVIKITISEKKDKRSLDQNNLYWELVTHVRNTRLENGDPVTIDQCHEDLLSEFSPTVKATRLDGAEYIRPKRSKEQSVEEMSSMITAIIARMADFGAPFKARDYD